MNKEKETMAGEQTVQPQEVENGTENKTVRKSISWVRILIATLIILLAWLVGSMFVLGRQISAALKSFERVKTEPKQEVTERPGRQIGGRMLPPDDRGVKTEPKNETFHKGD